MTVYLGDKAVGANTVVEKEVAKTKFGISIDNLIGNVDENGALSLPQEQFEVDLTGVNTIGRYAFVYKFYYGSITKISANDLTSVGSYCFQRAFGFSDILSAEFNGLEEIGVSATTEYSHFEYAFENYNYIDAPVVTFNKLKKVGDRAHGSFKNMFTAKINPDDVWPALEYIGGQSTFSAFCKMSSGDTFRFSNVKTIRGNASSFSAPIQTNYAVHFEFPNCTDCTDYIVYSYAGVTLHFAAANQAAIEACAGYENKFGANEIYFDL